MGGGVSKPVGDSSNETITNNTEATALRTALDNLDVTAVKSSVNYLTVHINENILPSDGTEEQTPLVYFLLTQDMENTTAQEICNFLIGKTIFFASQESSSKSTSDTSYDADNLSLEDIRVDITESNSKRSISLLNKTLTAVKGKTKYPNNTTFLMNKKTDLEKAMAASKAKKILGIRK
jgi:hypothetical protein